MLLLSRSHAHILSYLQMRENDIDGQCHYLLDGTRHDECGWEGERKEGGSGGGAKGTVPCGISWSIPMRSTSSLSLSLIRFLLCSLVSSRSASCLSP